MTQWDVFLSFRGKDTRYTFTDYLYDALNRTSIRTFKDDPELHSGEVISDALVQAIHDSKTYIVVFSENYASSRWCLDELVEIKSMARLVVPVFYYIDPSAVRHQTGNCKHAFEVHQSRFDSDTLDKWRVTLTSVANLSGYHVCRNMSQADIVNKIVDRILLAINPMTLDVAKYPVGLDSRVQDITTLLSSGTEGVIRIDMHGMGGVGKTTLAKAVYNQNYHRYEGSCFLANVREVAVNEKGLVCLQQQMINDVLKCKNIKIDNVDQGIVAIRARICLSKVLIVIDDLDDPKHLEFLQGPFAVGSRVIITTRNEDLLDSIKVESRYKVNVLGVAESRQLFTQHAFEDDKMANTFAEFSEEILKRAGGLPLALKAFGSSLLNQSEEGWRWFIHKLKRVHIEDVEKKLVVSFDSLKLVDPMLQDIFLDIACFFIGGEENEVVNILKTCYPFVNHNIDILKKRCLLTVNDRDELEMHDLLRDMGRNIAHNNSPNEPGKHSRLWVAKDICDVLKKHKGTEAIEGIIPGKFYYQDALEGVSFKTESFKKMSKLRFLYLKGVNLTGSFEHAFEDLRLLSWEGCPLKCLPAEFYPEKIVILELPCSKMRTMWELNVASHVFENLTTLDMSHSSDLSTTPDFTKLPFLESLSLKYCTSLEEVHVSIGTLVRLIYLDLEGCSNLRSLQSTICNLRSLEVLFIGKCQSLEALPTKLGNIRSLKELDAVGLTVSNLPVSIGRLSKLVDLRLDDNNNLETLPSTICYLRALKFLSVSNCKSLEALPIELGNIESLEKLYAEGLNILKLPESVGRLSKLVDLRLSYNRRLVTLPDTICDLTALEILRISYCTSLSTLPDSIRRLSKLVELRLTSNEGLKTLPDSICSLRALEVLSVDQCRSLESLPVELGNIQSLTELNAEGLTISKLPDSIGRLSKIVELKLSNNNKLKTLPHTISDMISLEILRISGCGKLEMLPDQLWNITRLRKLDASGSTVLRKLPDIEPSQISSSLECLNLSESALTALPSGFSQLSNLKYLDLKDCHHLLSIVELPPNLKGMTLSFNDGDERIKLRANGGIFGLHLLYKTENTTMDEHNSSIVSVEDERSYPSKQLKHLESDKN
ncbi:hypothetical protein AgCh_033727 [Apium graveolens]